MNEFYEFFSGGGMARLGLGRDWNCLFANDIDARKAAAYRSNFGGAPELSVCDVANLDAQQIPGRADLVWASFPCQDLSLAGQGIGLAGRRSGAFWPFWKLVVDMIAGGRKPKIMAIENVCGALTSHGGRDFAAIADAFSDGGFAFGAVVLDAADFVPQSRPRLFFLGVARELEVPGWLASRAPLPRLHPSSLIAAHATMSVDSRKQWLWWNIPPARSRASRLIDVIEESPPDVPWMSPKEIRALLSMMSPVNLAKVRAARRAGARAVGGIYRRTRRDENGTRVQRAEIRFDDIAGCLRTPAGGSSRQRILIVEGNRMRARLLSSREAARLMGIPDAYALPGNYNDAYRLAGDGVAVPVVAHLRRQVFDVLLDWWRTSERRAA